MDNTIVRYSTIVDSGHGSVFDEPGLVDGIRLYYYKCVPFGHVRGNTDYGIIVCSISFRLIVMIIYAYIIIKLLYTCATIIAYNCCIYGRTGMPD